MKGDDCVSEERKKRILVVDDDPGLQQLVQVLLSRAGMEGVAATSAVEAAQIMRNGPLPDLLILDLMLPDISGIEFLRQMRTKTMFDKLPVLILSALADPDQIREGLAAGADRYLTKPYLANNLIGTVNDLLQSGRKKA